MGKRKAVPRGEGLGLTDELLMDFIEDADFDRSPKRSTLYALSDAIFPVIADPTHPGRPLFGLKIKKGAGGKRTRKRQIVAYVSLARHGGHSYEEAVGLALAAFEYKDETSIRKVVRAGDYATAPRTPKLWAYILAQAKPEIAPPAPRD